MRDWSAAVPAANLRIESSAVALVGCGFSLSRPREGRPLPSERDANGGVRNNERVVIWLAWNFYLFCKWLLTGV